MRRLVVFGAVCVLVFSGCGVTSPKFNLDPGLDGCVTVKVDKLSVTGVAEANGVSYHRVNEKCKDIPVHPVKG